MLAPAPPRPAGLAPADSAAVDQMVEQVWAGDVENLQNTWSEFLRRSAVAEDPSSVDLLILAVLGEARARLLADLTERAEKAHHFQQTRKTLAEHIAELQSIHEEIDAGARVSVETIA